MSLIITRVLTLFSAAMLAVLVPVSLAGADRDTVSTPSWEITTVTPSDAVSMVPNRILQPNVAADAADDDPKIIDALVIERDAIPTDVIPNLPDVVFGGNNNNPGNNNP